LARKPALRDGLSHHRLTRDQAPSGGFFQGGSRYSCPVFGLRPKTKLKENTLVADGGGWFVTGGLML